MEPGRKPATSPSVSGTAEKGRRILIVGTPNVGKSVLFNALSRQYATVSNYPGTTVEISRGEGEIDGQICEIIDTPGMYSLCPISDEEFVGRRLLAQERAGLVLHVVDAKNLERLLPFTLQLLEAGLPIVLVLNMMDEVDGAGVRIDIPALATALGIPVVGTVSTTGRGIDELRRRIAEAFAGQAAVAPVRVQYTAAIEAAVATLTGLNCRPAGSALSARATALLLLRGDREIAAAVHAVAADTAAQVQATVARVQGESPEPLEYTIALRLQQETRRLLAGVITEAPRQRGFAEALSRAMMNPWTGVPLLLLVLYFGFYKFVGGFGAGTVVNLLEVQVFENWLNPLFVRWCNGLVPWEPIRALLVGEYGVLTLGVRYAVALVLPIVGFFFLVFAVVEDSGYLPRLAMLIDRVFKKIGLSGRAVIPMVLGLGCDTMATLVTRTLPTRREQMIATLLLALAVPCSAQLGVILALLHGQPRAAFVWLAVIGLVFLLVGWLAAKILPGERASFYMELPPLRVPKLTNVLIKTYVRVVWYLKEVLPLFILASVLIWVGQISGLFALAIRALAGPVRLLGLPTEAAAMFLFGFLRRDYGAAGLYDLHKQGLLDGLQLTVACVALTLFLPCIAQFVMNVKERGWRTGLAISAFVLFLSFAVAYVVRLALVGLGVTL